MVNRSHELATEFGHQGILVGTLRVWSIQWWLREYVLWPKATDVAQLGEGCLLYLENRTPHAVLSEVTGSLPAGSNENCTGS